MWAFILLFGILLPILLIAAFASAAIAAIALLRRRSTGETVNFSGIVVGYASIMMIVGVFMIASGCGLMLKASIAEVASLDFSYDPINDPDFGETSPTPNDQGADRDNDVIAAAVITLIGAGLFAPHMAGRTLLLRRGAQSTAPITRSYNLIALAVATIGFLAAAGTALGIVLQKLSDDTTGWQDQHPGEPLAFAIVLLPIAIWFAARLWQQVAADLTQPNLVSAPEPR